MSARRIARELAIIVMPQLPKNTEKLNEVEIMQLSDKAIHMLVDYARQNLMDAQALVVTASNELTEIEVEHESNKNLVEDLKAVPLNSAQIKEKLRTLETAISLVSEALDIPDMAMASGSINLHANCKKCGTGININVEKPHKEEVRNFVVRLVTNYLDNKELIDEFIKRARTKWRVERMVSVDRDILRLACAEAFFMHDIPVKVAVSEAVELSHRFADAKAAKFINGILGDLVEEAEAVRRVYAKKQSDDKKLEV